MRNNKNLSCLLTLLNDNNNGSNIKPQPYLPYLLILSHIDNIVNDIGAKSYLILVSSLTSNIPFLKYFLLPANIPVRSVKLYSVSENNT